MLPRCLLLLCLVLLTASAFAEEKTPVRPANRLAKESSPYLLHHAHNPVDWYPWGEAAFEKARKENKLVFLSSGYNSCHWCHVMERESFMDDGVAALLNEHFVCIKLDREERPEIDQLYVTALNAMGNRGGWPMSMFLTAEGKPIVGGTYWPREDREIEGQTVPGFKSILKVVIEAQQKEPDNLQKTAEFRAGQTKKLLNGGVSLVPVAEVKLERRLATMAAEEIDFTFDPVHGGYGSPPDFPGPKFPRPPLLKLIQAEASRQKSKTLDDHLHFTLEKLALSGTYDQLGGGFHRYSTERTWTVPHFEKMLYDNAQLLEVYARAYRETQKPLYRDVLVQTLAFVDRELTSPEGVFYTSLDADSSGEEGRFYVWTDAELAAALPDAQELALLKATYGAEGPANFEEEYHNLVLAIPLAPELAARLEPIKGKLLAVRSKRPRPSLDTKVLTSWNGEMIAGMALAGHVLKDSAAVQRAAKAADFLLTAMMDAEGRLLHAYAAVPGEAAKARILGCLDDYTHLTHGLLTLHEVTNDPAWLKKAEKLTEALTQSPQFTAPSGGYYYTSSAHEALFARVKDQYDGVQASGNSQAALNFVRLWKATGNDQYRLAAAASLTAFVSTMGREPRSLCTMAMALGEYLDLQEMKSGR